MPFLLESGKMEEAVVYSRIISRQPGTYYIPSYYLTNREAIQYMLMVDPGLFIRLGFTNFSNPWSLKQGAKKTIFWACPLGKL